MEEERDSNVPPNPQILSTTIEEELENNVAPNPRSQLTTLEEPENEPPNPKPSITTVEEEPDTNMRPNPKQPKHVTHNSKGPRIRKCKYCSRRFLGQSSKKLYRSHVRSHEKKYHKHWFKKKISTENRDCRETSENTEGIGGNRSGSHRITTENNSESFEDGKESRDCSENGEQSSENNENSSESNRIGKENNVESLEDHYTDEFPVKLESKQVYVYIVFAPEGVCSCTPSDLSNTPCECKLNYKKLVFDSVECLHDGTLDTVSYDCPRCKKKVLAHELKDQVNCKKCSDKFPNTDVLTEHQQACYGFKQSFQCLQCNFESGTRDQILKHTSTHSSRAGQVRTAGTNRRNARKRSLGLGTQKQNAYVCPICGEGYKDGVQLRKHVITHQQNKLKEEFHGRSTRRKNKSTVRRRQEEEEEEDDDDDDDDDSNYSDEDIKTKHGSPPVLKSGMSLRPRRKTSKLYVDDEYEDDDDEYMVESKKDTAKSLPHKCNFCERAFKEVSYLKNHKQAMHAGKLPYVCLVCLKRFQRRNDFVRHGQTHKGTIFKCQFCTASFSKMELLHNHDHVHRNDKPFNCTVCGATFLNANSLSKHFKTHTVWDADQDQSDEDTPRKVSNVKLKSSTYLCPLCKAMFKSADELKKHSKTHEVGRYKCKQCGLSCKSRLDLLNHLNRHKHKCQFCELNFMTLVACKKHEQSHIASKPSVYKCSFCAKEFRFQNDHKIHEGLHRQYDGKRPEPKKYKCKYCGKGLAYQSDLKIHEELHETRQQQSNEHFCNHCDKKFDSRDDLRRHKHNHFRDKLPVPTKCPDCDKVFKYGSFLREHKKTHWPEKPFVCVYCKARFKTKPELDEHEANHAVGKRHPCLLCSRRFTTKKNLRVHMRLHTGEKPYVCSFCPNRFAQISLRRRHERIHTGECPYVCEICDRAFPYDSSLKVHYESHRKKGIEVPTKVGMARGIRRKNAAYRKPPSDITKRKDPLPVTTVEQKPSTKSSSKSITTTSGGAPIERRQHQVPVERRRASSPQHQPVPVSLAQSPQNQRHDPNMGQNNNPNAPIQVTIQPAPIQLTIQQGEQMESGPPPDPHHAVVQGLIQRQQEDLQEASWDALHSRYLQQTSAPNWQPTHNWQQLGQQLPGASNWEMQSGNWSGPVPPPAHQGHSTASSVITSALYGIMQRDNEAQRGYQQ